jgi:hypothetical protein
MNLARRLLVTGPNLHSELKGTKMTIARKRYKKKPLKRSVKPDTVVTSTVITVRISDEEKIRIEKIMANLDIKRYSDVMRMALQMMKPTLEFG